MEGGEEGVGRQAERCGVGKGRTSLGRVPLIRGRHRDLEVLERAGWASEMWGWEMGKEKYQELGPNQVRCDERGEGIGKFSS